MTELNLEERELRSNFIQGDYLTESANLAKFFAVKDEEEEEESDEEEDSDEDEQDEDEEQEEQEEKDEDDESNDEEEDEDEMTDAEKAKALKFYNKTHKKDFKSWDAVTKSVKEADKAFAEAGKNKKGTDKKGKDAPAKQSGSQVSESLLEEIITSKSPEAELIMDELKADAKDKGVDILTLWKEKSYYKKEAKALFDEKQSEETNSKKVLKSASKISKKTDFSKITTKDIRGMSIKDRQKVFAAQIKRERESAE